MLMKKALSATNKIQASLTILSFFIDGRGSNLQKSAYGLYRSLLHQLYSLFPHKFLDLTGAFELRQKTHGPVGVKWDWMPGEIRQFLLSGLKSISKFSPLVIFIDALDEAGERQSIEIVGNFNDLMAGLKTEPDTALRICFACRHYPQIDLGEESTLSVEDFNGGDIALVTRAKTAALSVLTEAQQKELRYEIVTRSNGVFQWASLVVDEAKLSKFRGTSFRAVRSAACTGRCVELAARRNNSCPRIGYARSATAAMAVAICLLSVNAVDSRGRSVLHLAILVKNETISRKLVARFPVDVNLKEGKGNSPLHLACILFNPTGKASSLQDP